VIALLAGARRGIAAVAGCLGLLVAAAAMVCCAPAAAAPFSGRPTVVANSGFRPPVSGYAFANYGDVPGRPNLGSDEVRQLYGDGVCAGFSGGVCVLSPPALAWMQEENAEMAAGHCVGLSVTALFFYAHISTPTWFGAAAVPRLTIATNQLLARAIAYGYAFQTLDSVRRAEISGSPREVVTRLISALRTGSELYTLGITQPDGSGGHAVTPYEVERLRPNHYAILSYDNNYPRATRTVQLDTKSNSWSFDAAPTPDQPGSRYTGNTATHSLFLLPTLPGLGEQPCPFCSATPGTPSTPATTSTPATPSTPTAVPASVAAPPYEAIRLQTSGPVVGHLLITDRRGRRVGFVHGRLVNQIPGSRIIRLFVGGTRTWLDQTEPEYELPTGQRYTIELTTAGARRGRPAQSSHASVTVLEPGFLAAVRGINIQPGQHDQVTVPAGGHAISFVSHGTSRQAPELVLGNAADGANDHEWNITDQRTPSGRPISASLNVAKQSMSLVGAGRYDLSMDVVGNGVSVFAHRDVGIGAGITAGFDYSKWSAGDTMPVTETKHGIVVGRLMLSDEPDPSDTGGEFAPTESTPAPAEPQPHPEPPGASATTLVCSPATVPVGDTTTCHVDVSDLDSYASATPTGQVDFSSDQNGSFSEDRCTLSNAACEVTYTPTAVRSSTHDLSASYDGDHTYHPSHDTIAVKVTPSIKVTPVGAAPGSGTETSLRCTPPAVPVHAPTACTATVTNTGSGTPTMPTGEIEFSSEESGSFSEDRCTLSNGVCEVTYTPTAVGSGTHDLTASYDGDHTHQPSHDITTVQVHLRATDTSVECGLTQTEAWVGQSITCTATVTDTDSGTPSTPTGTVTFASDSSGKFSGNPCTLSAAPSNTSASCSIIYTPPSYSSAVPDISASYSGDSSHAGSAPSAPNALASRQLAAAPRSANRGVPGSGPGLAIENFLQMRHFL
jgi:hypothetical protein